MQAYCVRTTTGELAEFNKTLWVRLSGKTIRLSQQFHMNLLTAGMPTDTDCYVRDVEAFYVFLRRENVGSDRWRFKTDEIARQAYAMLVKIGEMYLT